MCVNGKSLLQMSVNVASENMIEGIRKEDPPYIPTYRDDKLLADKFLFHHMNF